VQKRGKFETFADVLGHWSDGTRRWNWPTQIRRDCPCGGARYDGCWMANVVCYRQCRISRL